MPALVRFCPRERAEQFVRGQLYLNEGRYFRNLENDGVRSDSRELADHAIQTKKVEIQSESGEWLEIGGIQNPITFRSANQPTVHLLCFYCLPEDSSNHLDQRMHEFGETAIVLVDPDKIMTRIQRWAQERSFEIAGKPVEYVDSQYEGPIGVFRKFDSFSYQSEFRVAIRGAEPGPLRIDIGTIEDSVRVLDSNELLKNLKYAAEAGNWRVRDRIAPGSE